MTKHNEEKRNEYAEKPGASPYDPLDVAKAEGRVLGKGFSGNYRKNWITRTGFFIFGAIFLATGIQFLIMTIQLFVDPVDEKSIFGLIMCAVLACGSLISGFFLFKNIFKK